jgi:bacteriocin biosynthesis cyclodehydratase domain-containing protein
MSVTGYQGRPAAVIRRPMVKAGLPRLRRPDGAMQFGIDPERSVLLEGIDEPTERWIGALDGILDIGRLHSEAAIVGVAPRTVAQVLELLADHGLLEDAGADCPGWADLPRDSRDRLVPDLASMTLLDPRPDGGKKILSRRLAATVDVRGGGRVGSAVAALLDAAGVGSVRLVDPGEVRPADLGPAGHRADRLGCPRGTTAPHPAETIELTGPDLVVFASDDGTHSAAGSPPEMLQTPHLLAAVGETSGVVGPLVVPGATACLRCLELARTDRDPHWPGLRAQLRGGRRVTPTPACDVVLATTVAGHAALQALAFLDSGAASSMDGTLHIRLPDGLVRRRSWSQHPACGCGWADTS